MAELPRPWPGIESSRPTSPQHSSMIESADARLPPFLVPSAEPFVDPLDSPPRPAAAPAPLVAPPPPRPGGAARPVGRPTLVHALDQGGEHVELLRVRVLLAVVLARDGAE